VISQVSSGARGAPARVARSPSCRRLGELRRALEEREGASPVAPALLPQEELAEALPALCDERGRAQRLDDLERALEMASRPLVVGQERGEGSEAVCHGPCQMIDRNGVAMRRSYGSMRR
jgi:hypothetical protein